MRTRPLLVTTLIAALTAAALTGCGADGPTDSTPSNAPAQSAGESPAQDADESADPDAARESREANPRNDPLPADQVGTPVFGTDVDSKVVATQIEMAYAADLTYPGTAPLRDVVLTPGNEVRAYEADDAGYAFCVVHTESGAYTFYDSQVGVAGSGDSGADCEPQG